MIPHPLLGRLHDPFAEKVVQPLCDDAFVGALVAARIPLQFREYLCPVPGSVAQDAGRHDGGVGRLGRARLRASELLWFKMKCPPFSGFLFLPDFAQLQFCEF